MNPWIIIGAGALWIGTAGAAFFYGQGIGRDSEIAKRAAADEVRRETREAAQQGAADAIAKLKPRNVTIRQETEREIRTNTVYADCRLPAAGLRLANEAITGQRPEPPGAGELPGAGSAVGRHDGSTAGKVGGAGQPVP